MISDLFLLHVFHAPSYCSFTSNLTMFSLIIDYWIDNGIYSAFTTVIINLIIDKSRLCYKITIHIDRTYCILNYTRIKPRSRPPHTQKKSAYFTHPDFSAAKIEKKVRKLCEKIRYLLGCGEISQYERCYPRPKLWKIQTSLPFYRTYIVFKCLSSICVFY
jgi:hypothetical protein